MMLDRLKFAIVVVFLMLFGLLSYAGQASQVDARTAEPTATMVASQPLTLLWQTAFDRDSALLEPDYITVDSRGHAYVGELSYGTVKEFDADGNFVRTIPIDSMDVTGIAVDSQGNILIVAWDKHLIQIFDSSGQYVADFNANPSLLAPAIAVDAQDNVYTVPLGQINKFDRNGKFLDSWSSLGSEDGQLGDAGNGSAIVVDQAGNVYTTDPANNRIVEFDSDGQFLANFVLPDDGKPVTHKLVFSSEPYGVAVDGQGNVYIVNSHFLRKLDAAGNILAQWPTTEGDLYRGGRVAVDSEGNIYIVAEADVKTADNQPFKALVLKKFQQN